ncbi:potassium channel subfamily K member 15 [Nematostella vectensis]|uniref:potassium channel subfamily K member 15 n=1 Tax=Nematostella vectensis TaxID=45351 RepID=UPI002076F986|nr:potassium channel subfamily K member 15 [Nematostella vectensis]XP_032237723.2 potassium channel subfamily K member 15 [Nematostella vectensis]
MHQLTRTLLIRSTVLFVYSLLSAWLFYELEKESVSSAVTADHMIAGIKRELKTKYNISENVTSRLLQTVVEAETVRRRLDWTFARSLFFVFTSLSTIGYGNITPKRATSQIIFVLFCIFGLPVMMLALKTAGDIIAAGLKTGIIFTERHVFNNTEISDRGLKIKTVILSMMASVAALGTMACVQSYVDGWTVIESFYAWGVTFSTIGFGDYVPYLAFDKTFLAHHDKYAAITTTALMAATLCPFLFMLSLVSCTLSSILDAVEVFKPFSSLKESCNCIRPRITRDKSDMSDPTPAKPPICAESM